jgi:antitoxin HicB
MAAPGPDGQQADGSFMSLDLRVDQYPFTVRPLLKDEGGGYLVEYPDLSGCVSDGDTPEDAVRNGRDAILAYVRSCAKHSELLPAPSSGRGLAEVPER